MSTERDGKRPVKKKGKMQLHSDANSASAARPPTDLIGQRLRSYYDEVASQPVPDRFVELLNQLEAKNQPKKQD